MIEKNRRNFQVSVTDWRTDWLTDRRSVIEILPFSRKSWIGSKITITIISGGSCVSAKHQGVPTCPSLCYDMKWSPLLWSWLILLPLDLKKNNGFTSVNPGSQDPHKESLNPTVCLHSQKWHSIKTIWQFETKFNWTLAMSPTCHSKNIGGIGRFYRIFRKYRKSYQACAPFTTLLKIFESAVKPSCFDRGVC